jgi:hypothetical protein
MTSNPRRAKGGGWAVLALGMLVVFLVGYVLSIGPTAEPMSPDQWQTVYWPLLYFADACPPARTALDWYLNLWHVEIVGPALPTP